MTVAPMLPLHRESSLDETPLRDSGSGGPMTKSQYGWIATAAGAAMAAAWWWRHRDVVARGMSEAGHDRGQTIFSNSPVVGEG